MNIDALIDRIFSIQTDADFEYCALELFRYQYEHVKTYRNFVDLLGRPHPKELSKIPFLPIQFYKSEDIISDEKNVQHLFKSSGTGNNNRSRHLVADLSIYERSFLPTFEAFSGPLENSVIVALLPSYVEQGESSLVYMVDKLIQKTNHPLSGYYLSEPQQLLNAISTAKQKGRKVILFGVSYALLDLAELHPDLKGVSIIETGGMKGRRKEMSKDELHATLCRAFQVPFISSEYGMCELLSQAYSNTEGLFSFPNWMRASLREITDPLQLIEKEGKTGGINIIDLANIYSCAFIETQDLGRFENNRLRLMGRVDHSEVRGCNLLLEE